MCALWIDKHRPKNLEELIVHPSVNNLLLSISQTFSFNHLLFSGPPGSGKKTRVLAFIRKVFDGQIENIKSEYINIETESKQIEVHVLNSPFHIELTPADSGNNDRLVISHFVKSSASSLNIQKGPKIIVLNEAHRLSKLAQQALRRLMEKYSKSCRFILISESLSQILDPIRSRCFIVRVPKVEDSQISLVLKSICQEESLKMNEPVIQKIVEKSNGDLRRGIVFLEALSLQEQKSVKSVDNAIPDWEKYVQDLVKMIVQDHPSVEMLKSIRSHLYELLVHCIPPIEIFRVLLKGLLMHVDPILCPQITNAAATYEMRMHTGQKPIIHLEAFVARFMQLFQDYLK